MVSLLQTPYKLKKYESNHDDHETVVNKEDELEMNEEDFVLPNDIMMEDS